MKNPITRNLIPTALAAVAATTIAHAGPKVLVDFGNATSYRGVSVPAPDANGKYWNSVKPGAFWADMIDTTNTATTIDLGFDATGSTVGTDSYNGPAGATSSPVTQAQIDGTVISSALGDLAVKEAAMDYVTASYDAVKDAGGRFVISGLNPIKRYRLTFYGSAKFNTDAVTTYSVYDDSAYSNQLATADLNVRDSASNWLYNQDRVAVVSDLIPSSAGNLYVSFVGSQGGKGYLNAMSIEDSPVEIKPESVLVDFGNDSSYASVAVTSPDANGNHWTSINSGTWWGNMPRANGAASTIGIGFSTGVAFGSYNGPAGATSNPITAAQIAATTIDAVTLGRLGVNEAAVDFASGTDVVFTIAGLRAGQTYNLHFFASRRYPSPASSTFTVYQDSGLTTELASTSLLVGVGGNANPSSVAITRDLTPSVGGALYVKFTGSLNSLAIEPVDTTAPAITVNGDNPASVTVGGAYSDAGATALDNVDGSFAATSTGTVDTTFPGTYTITYNATDAAGNAATAVTRTVNVVLPATPVAIKDEAVLVDFGNNSSWRGVAVSNPDANGNSWNSLFPGNSYSNMIRANGASSTIDLSFSTPVGTDSYNGPAGATSNPVTQSEIDATTIDTTYLGKLGVKEAALDYATSTLATPEVVFSISGLTPNLKYNLYLYGSKKYATTATYTVYRDSGLTNELDQSTLIVGKVAAHNPGMISVLQDLTPSAGGSLYVKFSGPLNSMAIEQSDFVPTDVTGPVITIDGDNPAYVNVGDTYTDAGATALDDVDGSVVVTPSGSVDTSIAGTYTITYTATDAANNTSTETRTVNVVVPDTTPPVITVLGDNPAAVNVGDTYTDAGATAEDDVDGPVVVTPSGSVDTSIVGTYTITYTATDAANNTATETRTVNVVVPDATPPVITVLGDNPATVNVGDTYTDAGATAEDDVDGSVVVTPSGSVDTSIAGTYTITYTATDAANNTATETRTVNVVAAEDTTPPVITLGGVNPTTVTWGDSYTDAGATATDDVDGSVNVSSSGSVNTAVAGSYTITYTATDAASNEASETRTVNVVMPANSNVRGSNGLSALEVYAFGGSGPTASVQVPTYRTVGGNLVLTAVIRTNDQSLTVTGKTSADLSTWVDLVTNPGGVAAADQTNLPAGTERREYTLPGGSSKRFLRLSIIRQ